MTLRFDDISIDRIPVAPGDSIQVDVLRLDKIDPVISGNKWFKLQHYIQAFAASGKKRLVTFGGYYSNHIVATAAACLQAGIPCTGIIRGEKPNLLSASLTDALSFGMDLCFSSRAAFREHKLPASIDAESAFVVAEGGKGEAGVQGAMDIMGLAPPGYTHYCCAVGTGTMMAGLLRKAAAGQAVIGISSQKNNFDLLPAVHTLAGKIDAKAHVLHDYHFGGYAKYNEELIRFMNSFYEATGIPSDIVYTGKLFYAVTDLMAKAFFPQGSRILLIHSGGLQGNRSLEKGTLIF